jgi:hypothetical protein
LVWNVFFPEIVPNPIHFDYEEDCLHQSTGFPLPTHFSFNLSVVQFSIIRRSPWKIHKHGAGIE